MHALVLINHVIIGTDVLCVGIFCLNKNVHYAASANVNSMYGRGETCGVPIVESIGTIGCVLSAFHVVSVLSAVY